MLHLLFIVSHWIFCLRGRARETPLEKQLPVGRIGARRAGELVCAYGGVRPQVTGVEKLPDNTRLVDWLRRLLEGKTVLARNAAPGALLCLPLRQACLACRERIYVLGLGYDVFSGEKESAVLLDDERRALSPAPMYAPGFASASRKPSMAPRRNWI